MTIAQNLCDRPETLEVVIVDEKLRSQARTRSNCRYETGDATKFEDVQRHSAGVHCAVLAVPGKIASQSLHHLVAAKVPTVDISFLPEIPAGMHEAAVQSGVPIIVGFGIAPGLSQVLAGALYRELPGLNSLTVYCGGFPVNPPAIFHHAVFFNAHDLLEQYVRPARVRTKGRSDELVPLSKVETLYDYDVGHLEAFVSDGVRSLLSSYPDVADMREMTLRKPGHLDTMRTLRDLGILNNKEALKGAAEAIEAKFPYNIYTDEILVEVWGSNAELNKRYRVYVQQQENFTAMSRATGFTAAAAANMIAMKRNLAPGVHSPEKLGENEQICAALTQDLMRNGIKVTQEQLPVGAPRTQSKMLRVVQG
eukprot:TRINITY_DN7044_c0_g1_i1.p1 TRINITY_DN7044_c0_g1~~TRINITY_DN7044_c0_g1_i1.p1  ORF type:complete len:422 (+),score=50.90 TRINITY_DN7044_c0_g1_i1:171-1268(+)